MERVQELVARRCEQFKVFCIGVDGASVGSVINRPFLMRLRMRCPMYAFYYSEKDHRPVKDGVLWNRTVDRTGSISDLFARVTKRMLLFPRVEDSGIFLDEFAGEFYSRDEYHRSIRYDHPDNSPDDTLHATTYALLLGIRSHVYLPNQRGILAHTARTIPGAEPHPEHRVTAWCASSPSLSGTGAYHCGSGMPSFRPRPIATVGSSPFGIRKQRKRLPGCCEQAQPPIAETAAALTACTFRADPRATDNTHR
jgi:hypothetical protein